MQWMVKLFRESLSRMVDSSGTKKLPLALEKIENLGFTCEHFAPCILLGFKSI